MSSARNAGESAIRRLPAQPSAEIVRRVREMQARVRFGGCPHNPLRRACASRRGVSGELGDEHWGLCSTTVVRGIAGVRGVAGELEAENWRLSSTTLVRGAICGAGS